MTHMHSDMHACETHACVHNTRMRIHDKHAQSCACVWSPYHTLSPAAAAATTAVVSTASAVAAAAAPAAAAPSGIGRNLYLDAVAHTIAPVHVATGVPLCGDSEERREEKEREIEEREESSRERAWRGGGGAG
jgi:hypothetical protein